MAEERIKNHYRLFRDPISNLTGSLSKRFDQPTYLTFKLRFYPMYNNIANTNYDKMPHPLFGTNKDDNIDTRNYYSTYQYLRDIKEPARAELLDRFIQGWDDIQYKNQWYFQSISGLGNLTEIAPGMGIRIPEDGKITINMLDAIDLRSFNLLNLYRKIAWDDIYQRWILPDMMRYFALDIYVTEFRTFHKSVSPYTPEQLEILGGRATEKVLQVIENTMPAYIIHCERCEFDITSLNYETINDNLSVAQEPNPFEVSFNINVGKVYEEFINPIFNLWWSDKFLSDYSRTNYYTSSNTPLNLDVNDTISPNMSIYAQNEMLSEKNHFTGLPWYESESHLENAKLGEDTPFAGLSAPDPTRTNTWIRNAKTFGTSFVKNFVESKIDKAKMANIPGTGISFNQIEGAIQSQSFISMFGLVRRAINNSVSDTTPSQELNEQITDNAFRNFLQGVSLSEATDDETGDLIASANKVLTSGEVWQKIKDYSLATDLISEELDEENIQNDLQSGDTDNRIEGAQDRSIATDLDGGPKIITPGTIIESAPSSRATNNNID